MMNDDTNLPKCIGVIMDGNRRWAKAQNLNTLKGHKRGAEVFEDSVKWLRDNHIKHGVFYAFSTENWNRSEEEIAYLLELFSEYIENLIKKLAEEGHEKKIRFRFLGDRSRFSSKLQERMCEAEKKSEEYDDLVVWVALSYGGRDEIVAAVNKAIDKGEPVTEETFKQYLWTNEMPDPDMIIRTGGKFRLSNFLPWQSVYSELFFTDTYWPDVTKEVLDEFLKDYTSRIRNFGK